ncbi:MAG: hypothetical protein CL908_18740 [Deltaproteobacteria bacterium]|nr:hypothetical protein [Deltaproteobacteria bacterium]
MRSFILILVLLVGVTASVSARAGEAILELETELTYDDNVFGTRDESPDGQDGDWSLRFTPTLRVQEERGDLQWDLTYKPAFEYFLQHNGLRGWDHDIKGELTWQITRQTSVTISDRFRRFGLESRFNETTDPFEGDDPVTESRFLRRRFKQNRARLLINHDFTPRHSSTIAVNHVASDRSLETDSDTKSYSASLGHLYAWTPRTRFGPAFSWSRRIQEPFERPDIETDFYNLSLRVIHVFDPSFSIDFSIGPALVVSDDSTDRLTSALANRYPGSDYLAFDSCPTLADGTRYVAATCEPLDLFANGTILAEAAAGTPNELSAAESEILATIRDDSTIFLPIEEVDDPAGDEVTYFADVSFRKVWKNWTLNGGYRRSDDSSSSTTSITSISDRLYATLQWRATPRLRFDLNVSWRQSQQEQEIASLVTALNSSQFAIDTRACDPAVAAGTPLAICISADSAAIPTLTGRAILFDNIAEAIGLRQTLTDVNSETTLIHVRLGGRYRLNKRAVFLASATWRRETGSSNVSRDRVTERVILRAGVEYEFEPFRF